MESEAIAKERTANLNDPSELDDEDDDEEDDDDQSYCCERDTRLVHAHRRVECPWCKTRKSHSIEGSHQGNGCGNFDEESSYSFGANATDDNIVRRGGRHETDRCCVCCCGRSVPSNVNSIL